MVENAAGNSKEIREKLVDTHRLGADMWYQRTGHVKVNCFNLTEHMNVQLKNCFF